MNYEMLAEIDDEIGDLHILDTANTVRIEYISHLCVQCVRMHESYNFHMPYGIYARASAPVATQ